MKILFLFFLVFPLLVFAQQDNTLKEENIRLKNRIDSLERRVDEKFYTRVPNIDFDRTLQDMVDKQVGTYISGKIALTSTIIGLISFLLGFLAKYFFSESTRKQIDDSVSELSKKITEDNLEAKKKLDVLLAEQKEFINTTNGLFDDRIKDISLRLENFRSMLENRIQQFGNNTEKRMSDFESTTITRLKQFEDQQTKLNESQITFEKTVTEMLDSKITDTMSFLWGDVINSMLERAANKKYEGKDLPGSFEKLLERDLKVSDDLKIQIIDTLMRCYYSSEETNKYEKMVKLIQNYEADYDLLPQTYVNAAIAHSNIYELYGTDELKETALINCDKSIKKEPSYGEPYAVKLEILMIDLLKSRDPNHQSEVRQQMNDLLYLINSIESPLLKGYFLERLITDKSVSYLEKYIKAINKDFAAELLPVRENVIHALYENYGIATDREKALFTDLLQQGLDTNPNIDGLYYSEDIFKGGVQLDKLNDGVTLELKDSTYSITYADGHFTTGMVYYFPDVNPYALNLVPGSGEEKFKTTRAIFEFDEPAGLRLCMNEPDQERPVDFISTAENQYILTGFTKTVV
jgi:uncharacterized protein (TIGR03067 family)